MLDQLASAIQDAPLERPSGLLGVVAIASRGDVVAEFMGQGVPASVVAERNSCGANAGALITRSREAPLGLDASALERCGGPLDPTSPPERTRSNLVGGLEHLRDVNGGRASLLPAFTVLPLTSAGSQEHHSKDRESHALMVPPGTKAAQRGTFVQVRGVVDTRA